MFLGIDLGTGSVKAVLDPIIVSHAPNRKIQGAFHESTAYGFRKATGKYHYRKRLDASFSPKAVESIADPVVRGLVKDRLAAFGGDPKKAFVEPLLHADGVTPIRSVRLTKNAAPGSVFGIPATTDTPYKYYDLGNNHHIEIFEDPSTGKRSGEVVSMIEAARRARRAGEPVVNRLDEPKRRFVMSLIINDMVRVGEGDDTRYYRVQKISGDTTVTLREHKAATLDDSHDRLFCRPSTFKGQKVSVDPIGRVSLARD